MIPRAPLLVLTIGAAILGALVVGIWTLVERDKSEPGPEPPDANGSTGPRSTSTTGKTGIPTVDEIISSVFGDHAFESGRFFEPVTVACVTTRVGAPAPVEGPACSPSQPEGSLVKSVQIGPCSVTWFPADSIGLPEVLQGLRPTETYAVLEVNRELPVLGFVAYVVYFADRTADGATTLVLTMGSQGVKQVNTACGQPPERSIPSNVDPKLWILPPRN